MILRYNLMVLLCCTLLATAVFLTSAHLDLFEQIAGFVDIYDPWQLDELLVVLMLFGSLLLLQLSVGGLTRGRAKPGEMDFIIDLVRAQARDKGEAAVFVIRLREGFSHQVIEQATTQLSELVGEDRLITFRVS